MIKFPDRLHFGKDRWAAAGPRRSAFWFVAGIFILAALLGADVIWTIFEEWITILFEFVAERLEHFFQKTVGLDLYHAQMATAYSGALIFLSVGLLLLRKFAAVAQHVRVDGCSWWRERSAGWISGWRARASMAIAWWAALDLLNKSAVVIALVVMVIPITLLISYALGTAVAEIF